MSQSSSREGNSGPRPRWLTYWDAPLAGFCGALLILATIYGALFVNTRLLFGVRSALRRMQDGTFGICLHCEEEISLKRLDAVPWARHCIACREFADRKAAHGHGGDIERGFENAA